MAENRFKGKKFKKIPGRKVGRESFITSSDELELKKKVLMKKMPKSQSEVSARKQIEILENIKQLNHPSIAKYLGFQETTEDIYLEFEYYENGNLEEFLSDNKTLLEHQALKVIQQIFSGLHAIHRLKISHCDLKLENILIDDNYNLKITDFDSAVKDHPDENIDILAFGTIVQRILLGKNPNPNGTSPSSVQLSKRATDLISKLLVQDPEQRPSFDDLLNDEWINGSLFNEKITIALPDSNSKVVNPLELWYPDTSAAFRERYYRRVSGEMLQDIVYKCDSKIGDSSIYTAAELSSPQQQVVIKQVSKSNKDAQQRVLNEIYFLKKLQSPYTVRLLDHLESKQEYFLIFEKCENGDLGSFITTLLTEHQLYEYQARQFILDLLKCVKILYISRTIHGRIRLDHILLDADFKPKICGFAEAVSLNAEGGFKFETEALPDEFHQKSPPEALNKHEYFPNSDIWSWGFVFASILKSRTGMPSVPKAVEGLSGIVKDFIGTMLKADHSMRTGYAILIGHPWISKMNSSRSEFGKLSQLHDFNCWYKPPSEVSDQLEKAYEERKKYVENAALYLEEMNDECSNVFIHVRTENGDILHPKELADIKEMKNVKIFYSDGAIYKGDIKDGKRHGKGEMKFASGEKYNGDWKEDLMDGNGIYVWLDGPRYNGPFKRGKREGRCELYEDGKGATYKGELCDDKICGEGKAEWPNRTSYHGDWSNGYQHGIGEFQFENHEKFASYKGEWKEGKMGGKGKFVYKNGDIYDGEFEGEGLRHGTGEYIWKMSGMFYRGEWKNDRREGQGELICKEGESCRGSWKNDVMEGRVTIRLPPTAHEGRGLTKIGDFSEVEWMGNLSECCFKGVFTLFSGKSYKGEWLRFRKHGYGESVDADGPIVRGKFFEDNPSGEMKLIHLNEVKTCYFKNGMMDSPDTKSVKEAEFIWLPAAFDKVGQVQKDNVVRKTLKDGTLYEGGWKDNMPHGKGYIRFPDSTEYKGGFEKGKKHGRGQETAPDKTKYSGTWLMGKKQGEFVVEHPNEEPYIVNFDGGNSDDIRSNPRLTIRGEEEEKGDHNDKKRLGSFESSETDASQDEALHRATTGRMSTNSAINTSSRPKKSLTMSWKGPFGWLTKK